MGRRSRQIDIVTEVVPTLPAAAREAVDRAVAAHRHRPGALMPILHAVQDALGHVPDGALPLIAHALNISRADVHGCVSFYHEFRSAPPGRHVVRICGAEACQAMGSRGLQAHARRSLGIDGDHGTSADGAVTLEPVYCLGNCALSPAVMIDGQLHGRVSPERFDALIAACRSTEEATA
ncbi:formate dehydrogenase subunit gamma [Coralloluteibacterium stylophorae]|uniref:NADH-quinone oxidoreductase subunit E n=1 Tax=Coralloluteibacterium stylophorae TaxID=1776034 RepID=A0A8J7VST1_9GAMM|nr:formate dehydrogenase subunit gamma [Coralloluteibacterium stylophorae]MBS7456230.1 formate dehydrogenase subunit gamma [Coralloluteibacterium stylophorae]